VRDLPERRKHDDAIDLRRAVDHSIDGAEEVVETALDGRATNRRDPSR
jgi:hypothetical protein